MTWWKEIPLSRLILYMMAAGLLPVLFALMHYFSVTSSLDTLEMQVLDVTQMAYTREKQQAVNMAARQYFKEADRFYIDKYLESLSFLEPEVASLQKIASNPAYPEDEIIKKRLDLLSGPGNAMVFSEGVVQSYPFFKETTETLVHSIEVNVDDIQKILSKIEGIQIGHYAPGPNRPQLIVLDIKLDKKRVNTKNEVFTLNLKLLKREYS